MGGIIANPVKMLDPRYALNFTKDRITDPFGKKDKSAAPVEDVKKKTLPVPQQNNNLAMLGGK